jgi:transcriptional regulator of NAD metabolism
MDVYGHVSRQMQLNSASKLESFIQNINEKVSLIEEGTTMQD